MSGGSGNDVLEGPESFASGPRTVRERPPSGGPGADVIRSAAGDDTIDGGSGVDLVDYFFGRLPAG